MNNNNILNLNRLNNFVPIQNYNNKYYINRDGVIISMHRNIPYIMNIDSRNKLHLSLNGVRTHYNINNLINDHFN